MKLTITKDKVKFSNGVVWDLKSNKPKKPVVFENEETNEKVVLKGAGFLHPKGDYFDIVVFNGVAVG